MNNTYVVIVNWNGWKDTVLCLDSLFQTLRSDFHPIICDNGSTDGSTEKIISWAEQRRLSWCRLSREQSCHQKTSDRQDLTLIDIEKNLGFAGGTNVGIRYALQHSDCSYIWLLNNDTTVTPTTLSAMLEYVEPDNRVGMCGSTLLYAEAPYRVQAQGGAYYCRWIAMAWPIGWGRKNTELLTQKRVEGFMNYVNGASMLVTRRFVEEVGLLNEDYFLYFEEIDWVIRAKGLFTLRYAPHSIVYHKVGGSIGTSSNPSKMSFTSDYYNIRNRLLFTRRNYPAALPTVWLVIAGSLLLRLCMGKWDRVMMILRLLCGNTDVSDAMPPDFRTKS